MLNFIPEIIAVMTAILYLVLAAKEDIKCWYAAIISSSLYFFIMFDAGLIMESILQIFYISMAIYGWNQWNKVSNEGCVIRIKKWKINNWKSSNKKPVKNKDLWTKLDSLCQKHKVNWMWVKAHAGNEMNNLADELAVQETK